MKKLIMLVLASLMLILAGCSGSNPAASSGGGGGGGTTPPTNASGTAWPQTIIWIGGFPTFTPSNIVLTWTNATGATGYNIYRSTVAGTLGTLQNTTPVVPGATTTTYMDYGVTAGTTYYYTIKSVNPSGEGPGTAQVVVTAI